MNPSNSVVTAIIESRIRDYEFVKPYECQALIDRTHPLLAEEVEMRCMDQDKVL
jgi:hypothetical protein